MFNSPAKYLFHNITQFNDFYKYPYYYTPKKSIQTNKKNHTLSYPFNIKNPNKHHKIKTHANHIKNTKKTQLNKIILKIKKLT